MKRAALRDAKLRRWHRCLPRLLAQAGDTKTLATSIAERLGCTYGHALRMVSGSSDVCPSEEFVLETERQIEEQLAGRLKDGWWSELGHLLDLPEFKSRL